MLVIPITSRNDTQYTSGYYYIFLYNPETSIQIKAVPLGSRKFIVADGFPPGTYEITGIKSLSSPSEGTADVSTETNDFDTSIPVQIRPNEITLVEYMFSVEQKYQNSTSSERYSQGYNFKPLTQSEYSQALRDLQNLPNAELWNLAQIPAASTTDQTSGVTSSNQLYLSRRVWN